MNKRVLAWLGVCCCLALTACGPSTQESAVNATVEAAKSAATVQAAVNATLAVIPTAVDTAVPPTSTPAPARPISTSTPAPTATPVARVSSAPARPSVGQQLTVGSFAYLVPDGAGKALASDAAVAVLTQDPKGLLAAAAGGKIHHLVGGTTVQVLDPPGPHGTHVLVLDGKFAGTRGSMLNRSLGF